MATPGASYSSQTVNISESLPNEKEELKQAAIRDKKDARNKKKRDKNASEKNELGALWNIMQKLEIKIPLFAPKSGERDLSHEGVVIEGNLFRCIQIS